MIAADIAVIGAGPAGAWTAYLLASCGVRVMIVDPSHPREKPCGGGITARALALVARALPASALPAISIRSARFVDSATNRSATVALARNGVDRPLVVASRSQFDCLLLAAAERAGAETLVARVADIAPNGGMFVLRMADGRTRTAVRIVGADGANSLARRRLTRPFRRDQISIATGFFAHGVTSDGIVVEWTCDPPGYLWSFPRPDHLAIGICAQADHGVAAAALRARTSEWMRITGLGRGARLQPYSWPIPSLSACDFGALDVAGPGWMLVGDAAGLVDPITREGIFFALRSAECAADAILSASAQPHHDYVHRVRSELGAELARAARFKAEFFQPRFIRLMMDALRRSARIRSVMADLVAGTQSYGNLKWRLAKTMELGLAWRMLRERHWNAELAEPAETFSLRAPRSLR